MYYLMTINLLANFYSMLNVETVRIFRIGSFYPYKIEKHRCQKKIEHDPKQPTYIETVYSVGYRLVGPT